MKCLYPVETSTGSRPCGQCQNCMITKQLQWKFRLSDEVLRSDCAFWLTLQYDDEHLPRSNGIPCVSKKDCQNYFRKLRKSISEKDLKVTCKYFLTSEYGPSTLRPHYHVLLLFKLPKMAFNRMLEVRQVLYEECKSRWYHGHVQASLFHSGVIRYLTKYVFKTADSDKYPVPVFRLISKGIGEEKLKDLDLDQLIKNKWISPYGLVPRYYRDKLLPTRFYGVKLDKNISIRRKIFEDTIDPLYSKNFRELSKFDNDMEKYIKNQKYLLRCQKVEAERKQKQKFG